MRETARASTLGGLAALSLVLTGCQTPQSREVAACLDRTDSIAYLGKVRDSIAQEWKKPAAAAGRVIVIARVNRDGKIRNAQISVDDKDGREDLPCRRSRDCGIVGEPLRKSMEAAIRKARPVGAPPEGALCMLERSLELTFDTGETFVLDSELEAP